MKIQKKNWGWGGSAGGVGLGGVKGGCDRRIEVFSKIQKKNLGGWVYWGVGQDGCE